MWHSCPDSGAPRLLDTFLPLVYGSIVDVLGALCGLSSAGREVLERFYGRRREPSRPGAEPGGPVSLSAADRDAIVAQAKREYPNECCGVLLGHGRCVERIRATANGARSPVVFQVEPRELLDVLLAAEAESIEVLGYYHSHTGSPAYPSPTDVRYAAGWPGAVHLIVSLAGVTPSLRAYSIEAAGEAAPLPTGGRDDSPASARGPEPDIRELEVLLR